MSKIGYLQNCLKDVFDQFALHFLNKMHWNQLQYQVDQGKRILFFLHEFRKDADIAVIKVAMYALEVRDFYVLRSDLAGLVLTLALWQKRKQLSHSTQILGLSEKKICITGQGNYFYYCCFFPTFR